MSGIDIEELKTVRAPFLVRRVGGRRKVTVTGFSKNDPLGVGGNHMGIDFGDYPCVYFKGGGWIYYSIS